MSQAVMTEGSSAATLSPRDPSAQPRRGRNILAGLTGAAAVLAVAVVWAYRTVPLRNNDDPQVDALLVLGTPTDQIGHLTEAQRGRVDEAVREYRRGRAQHIVITGGPTVNGFVEARVMGAYARSQGVPESALIEEDAALTTVQNIRNSARILDAHGWRRVEVISSPEHLPRAALILQREDTDLLWHMHAAPTPGRGRLQRLAFYAEEAVGTTMMRVFGLHAEPVLHGVAKVQHAVAFAVVWCWRKAKALV